MFAKIKDIRTAFNAAKRDVNETKRSMTDWILFLNSNQRDMKIRLYELERKVRQLELEKEIVV